MSYSVDRAYFTSSPPIFFSLSGPLDSLISSLFVIRSYKGIPSHHRFAIMEKLHVAPLTNLDLEIKRKTILHQMAVEAPIVLARECFTKRQYCYLPLIFDSLKSKPNHKPFLLYIQTHLDTHFFSRGLEILLNHSIYDKDLLSKIDDHLKKNHHPKATLLEHSFHNLIRDCAVWQLDTLTDYLLSDAISFSNLNGEEQLRLKNWQSFLHLENKSLAFCIYHLQSNPQLLFEWENLTTSDLSLLNKISLNFNISNENKVRLPNFFIEQKQSKLALFLLQNKWCADEFSGPKKERCIHTAIRCGDKAVFDFLVKNQFAFYKFDGLNNSPLHTAIQHEYKDFVDQILQLHPLVQHTNFLGQTPLHLAAQYNRHEVVQELLKRGANPKIKDNKGYTPLMKATYANAKESFELLFYHEAIFQEKDKDKNTLLHIAILGQANYTFERLLAYGSPYNYQNKNGSSCLHLACQINNPYMTKTLLNKKNIKIDLRDQQYCTPFQLALLSHNSGMIYPFLDRVPINLSRFLEQGKEAIQIFKPFQDKLFSDWKNYFSHVEKTEELKLLASILAQLTKLNLINIRTLQFDPKGLLCLGDKAYHMKEILPLPLEPLLSFEGEFELKSYFLDLFEKRLIKQYKAPIFDPQHNNSDHKIIVDPKDLKQFLLDFLNRILNRTFITGIPDELSTNEYYQRIATWLYHIKNIIEEGTDPDHVSAFLIDLAFSSKKCGDVPYKCLEFHYRQMQGKNSIIYNYHEWFYHHLGQQRLHHLQQLVNRYNDHRPNETHTGTLFAFRIGKERGIPFPHDTFDDPFGKNIATNELLEVFDTLYQPWTIIDALHNYVNSSFMTLEEKEHFEAPLQTLQRNFSDFFTKTATGELALFQMDGKRYPVPKYTKEAVIEALIQTNILQPTSVPDLF